jgi:hypothetical protein
MADLIGLFCGLIGVLIGHRLRLGGDAAVKRKRFRSYIELLRREVKSKQPSDFVFDWQRTIRGVPKFEGEILEVRPHIPDRHIKRFDDACAAYKTLPFHDYGESQKNQEAQAKLVSLLNEISECAK